MIDLKLRYLNPKAAAWVVNNVFDNDLQRPPQQQPQQQQQQQQQQQPIYKKSQLSSSLFFRFSSWSAFTARTWSSKRYDSLCSKVLEFLLC